MKQQFDALVVGGGVVGLSAALAMAKRDFKVGLIDAGALTVDSTKPDPRVYALNHASQALLEKLGVWQRLDKNRLAPYRHMYVWDAKSGSHIEFDARLIASDNLGAIVEESVLKKALLEALFSLDQKKLSLLPNTSIKSVETTAAGTRVGTEQDSWQTSLLMCADGAHSPCRDLLKVDLTTWPYHQQALVALVHTEKAHQQTAYQVFNPDGPLAFLPLHEPRQCSIVWSTTSGRAKQLMALAEEDFNRELTAAFASKLGQVLVEGRRYQFPLVMRHAQQYSGTGWLLLGDAAHTIHPLAGLGLNVGLADLATWLSCLDKVRNLLTAKSALGSYQRQRKAEVWQVIAMMEGLKTLFTNPLPPVVALRGLGLRLCNNLGPLKRFFIEQAIGKTRNYL